MPYIEESITDMLTAWPTIEGRILHLYELDPTHATGQPASTTANAAAPAAQASRATQPFCVLADTAATPVLLELDPTHLTAH